MKLVNLLRFLFLLLYLPLSAEHFYITLNERQLADLEMILNDGFAPLKGFMDKPNYDRVVQEMRLKDGTLWPIPVVLDISEALKQKIEKEKITRAALCDQDRTILAFLDLSEIWQPDKEIEAQKVYGTTNRFHSGVGYLFDKVGPYYVGGKVKKVAHPAHYDFLSLRKTPAELKAFFKKNGYKKVVAFQTRNPMHRAHVELTKRAAEQSGAHLLLHPVVGPTKPGDVDYVTRVKCYEKILRHYPQDSTTLSLLPIAMRMAGPREALWHMIIRKNYGCTHFIVGRDHASPGKDENGVDFYSPYESHSLVERHAKEIGIEIITSKDIVYVLEENTYKPIDEVEKGKKFFSISGTDLRSLLTKGSEIPQWFSYTEVIAQLKKTFPSLHQRGLTLFLTGLPAAGKSTLAGALEARIREIQDRSITVLDGDLIRNNLSKELGFSKEHRSINVRRVGFVANEITKNQGIAICALIAPFEEDRLCNRKLISSHGNYVEIYVSTSLQECEKRDPKGLYALARSGKLKGFTGIDDPYEVPKNPELSINTAGKTINECVDQIIDYLTQKGYLSQRF